MRKVFLVFILFALVLKTEAQIETVKRLEFELKDGYSGERIFELGQNGLIMASKKDGSAIFGPQEWKFNIYDTDLNHKIEKKISLEKGFYLDESFVGRENLHLLFKSRKGEFILYTINGLTGNETRTVGLIPRKSFISSMSVVNDYAYFYGYSKRENFLYSVNWKSGKVRIMPIVIKGYKSKNIHISHFQLMEEVNEIFLYVNSVRGNESEMNILRLSDQGQQLGIWTIKDESEYNIIDMSTSLIGENRYIFTGTYGKRKTFSFGSMNMVSSNGLFFGEANGEKINYINYYNFTDLENFFDFLPERRQEKIEKRVKRKEEKGKTMNLNYRIADHPVILLDDGYLFVGEAYYPTFRSEPYTTYVNGRAVTSYRTVFDGFQYTHAIVTKYDKSGRMMWDEQFKMWPLYKPFLVHRFISVAKGNQNGIHLAFANGDEISTKSIDFDGNVLTDESYETLETAYGGDKSRWAASSLDHWYDKYFLAYGFQVIKNSGDDDVKRKRRVFFISKIRLNN